MKKITYSLFIVILLFVSSSSTKAVADCEKCKQCAVFSGTAYRDCVSSYCDGNIKNCEKNICDSCKPDDLDCLCIYCGDTASCEANEVIPGVDDNGTYLKISCGDIKIPVIIPELTSTIITIIQIAVPVLIILFGSLDLVKAVMAQKEDEIKKGQQTFFKRLIAGCIVFFVVLIVKMTIGLVAPHDAGNASMWDCVDYFITGVK